MDESESESGSMEARRAHISKLLALAAQPVLPAPYPTGAPVAQPMEPPGVQERFPNKRAEREYIAARGREKSQATRELIELFRHGTREPELTIVIDRMMRGVILADDPIKTLYSLLLGRVEGRPPADNEAAEFEIAIAVARRVRRGKELQKAICNLAEALEQRCPNRAKSKTTIERWYRKHELAAQAELSLQELLSGGEASWEQLPTFEEWHRGES